MDLAGGDTMYSSIFTDELAVDIAEALPIIQSWGLEYADLRGRVFGKAFESLSAEKPSLIVCDISGYGSDGPYRDKNAYDLLIQSEAGLLSVTGTPEVPGKAGASMSRCWRRWPSGWAARCATASMAHPRRNAPVPATPRSIRMARFRSGRRSTAPT